VSITIIITNFNALGVTH